MKDDRKRQVKTTREKNGADHYQKIGGKGGKTSSGNLTPEERAERAQKAAQSRWGKYREKQKGENDNGEHLQDVQPTK